MMGQKLLHELLNEDQEPFLLNACIKNKTQNQLQLKKTKPISQTTKFAGNFCKNPCFFALPDSPDPRKSPICFSVRQSPKSPNNVFLHVPAKTAALLLEAALKIQRNSAAKKPKPQRFGLFGSLLKRLTHISHRSSKTKKGTTAHSEAIEACACRRSNSGDKSSVLDAWTYSRTYDSIETAMDEIDFMIAGEFDCCHETFCESPFRFVLQSSPPSSGHRTPDLPSPPAASPIHCEFEHGRNNSEMESLRKLTVKDEEEEEEKEQSSPVCVLDPPFEDDDDESHEREDQTDDGFDYECSYAIVQRAKQQLLKKLYRFEKLAELDPIELEKRMLEHDSDEDITDESASADEAEETRTLDHKENNDISVTEVLKSSFHHPDKVPNGMTKLVADLLAEEERKQRYINNREMVARGVCKRLETWQDVDLDTIDMIVEHDLRRDVEGWIKKDQEQVGEVAMDIEVSIFGLMVEELSEELVAFNSD